MEKWAKWVSREGVDLTTLVEVDRAFYGLLFEYTGKYRETLFTTLKNRVFTHYIKNGHREFGRFLYRKYLNEEKQIKKFIKRGNYILRETLASAKKWRALTEKGNDRSRLISGLNVLVKEFKDVNYFYSIMSFAAIEAWQKDFQEILGRLLKKNRVENAGDDIAMAIARPWKKSAQMLFQEKLKAGRDVERLVQQYQFLRSWALVWYEPITRPDVIPGAAAKKSARQKRLSPAAAIALLRPNAQEKKFLELSPYIVYLKDWRDELRRKQAYCWSFLFDVVARCLKISRDDLGYLSLQEILHAVKMEKIDRELIRARKNNLCIVTSNDPKKIAMKLACGPAMQKYLKLIKQTETKERGGNIAGFVAQKGKAAGIVQIIRSGKDIAGFKRGSVLVANSTHPNYLPAMHKSIAIVTNEGGIASHAAIVARELGIPCIVGTHNATRVLQNGDRVEVDANKGVVRKI